MSSNADKIANAQSNLPKPEQPPVASDFNSADPSLTSTGVGSGGVKTASHAEGLENADPTKAGREAKDNLGGLPNDAVTREAKNKAGLADTTGKDYGYPQKNDPSSGN